MPSMQTDRPRHPAWMRTLWLGAGALALLLGVIGAFVPLLPTTPFVLLSAFCFSRGCMRCEAWLLAHPRLGPIVRDWRAERAVPLRAKQLASVMMVIGCVIAWPQLAAPWQWAPVLVCAAVAAWLWSLPTRRVGV
jgi:uncharacterized membrane protein YbaN (DUF454 family)